METKNEIKEVEKKTEFRLVNARPIKEFIKTQDGLLIGGAVADALKDKVEGLLIHACARAKANGRRTVQPQDL